MFNIQIADIVVAIDNKYPFVENVCTGYITDNNNYDFIVRVSENEIDAERNISEEVFSDGYIESICIYRNIAKKLPEYNAFVMHCAAIAYDGNAYCFSAKSGTGKTTHIKLWRKVFGEKVIPINGDKPVIKLSDNAFYVFGTPWSGKENFNTNTKAPLKGLCFIERGQENQIEPLSIYKALNLLMQQIYIPDNNESLDATITLIESMLTNTPLWHLKCNISDEAANIAFNAMVKL